MTTTIVQYVQQPYQPFQFDLTLDGQPYTATVTWSLFGRRLYINLFAASGERIFTLPLIGSPPRIVLQSISWDSGWVTAVTAVGHGYQVLDLVPLVVRDCAPDAYNGDVRALVKDVNTLTWQLAANPGEATRLGTIGFDLDIAAGYFSDASALVYRDASKQFEVTTP